MPDPFVIVRAEAIDCGEMAAKMRVTVVIVKHLNKGVNAKAVHKVSGSAGYVNGQPAMPREWSLTVKKTF